MKLDNLGRAGGHGLIRRGQLHYADRLRPATLAQRRPPTGGRTQTRRTRENGAGRPVMVGNGACPLRQLRETHGGVGGASVACQASASADVTAVTSCSSSTPLFFGRRVIAKSRGRNGRSAVALRPPLGLGRLRSRQRDFLS